MGWKLSSQHRSPNGPEVCAVYVGEEGGSYPPVYRGFDLLRFIEEGETFWWMPFSDWLAHPEARHPPVSSALAKAWRRQGD